MSRDAERARAQLIALEHESHEAFLKRDPTVLERLLADDFIFTDPAGRLWSKAEWIADLTTGATTFESIHIDDLIVRVYGDAAVVNGRVSMRMLNDSQPLDEQYSYTVMYVRRGDGWQAVSEQAGLLAQQ